MPRLLQRYLVPDQLKYSSLTTPGPEAETQGREAVPTELGFRNHGLQVAANVVETHMQRPGVQFADVKAALNPSSSSRRCLESGAIDGRRASPYPIDVDEDENEEDYKENDVPGIKPQTGVLGILLDLYKYQAEGLLSTALSDENTPLHRGRSRGSSDKTNSGRNFSLTDASTIQGTNSSDTDSSNVSAPKVLNTARTKSSFVGSLGSAKRKKPSRRPVAMKGRPHWPHDEGVVSRVSLAIRSHISRQLYLIKLCKALMTYGAPTHRLEA